MKVLDSKASMKEAVPCGTNEAAVKDKLLDHSSDHDFSIELESCEQLRGFNIPSGRCKRVFIQGSLGNLVHISLVESVMLEIQCLKGTFRIDLTEEDYRKAIQANGGLGL